MIRVAVMYKNVADSTFDMTYYRERHMPFVRDRYAPHGLVRLEMDEAVSKSGKQAAPYIAIAYMTFESLDQFIAAFKAAGSEVMADIKNFTATEPTIQISKATEI